MNLPHIIEYGFFSGGMNVSAVENFISENTDSGQWKVAHKSHFTLDPRRHIVVLQQNLILSCELEDLSIEVKKDQR